MFGYIRNKMTGNSQTKKEIDLNAVEAYLEAFMHHNGIDQRKFLLKEIRLKEESDYVLISLHAGFPGVLIGPEGKVAKKFSKGLSKHLGENIRVAVLT